MDVKTGSKKRSTAGQSAQSARPAEVVDSQKPSVPPSRYVLFFSISIAGLAADLATKEWIFRRLKWHEIEWIWPEHAGFELSLNEGALFGMGQGWIPLFVALSLVAAVGIVVWLFVAREAYSRWLTVALACVMGGILGNLYDRLGLHGLRKLDGERVYAVRDWILWQLNSDYRWPNFNIADSLLVCGAIMLVVHSLFFEQRKPTNEQPAGEPKS